MIIDHNLELTLLTLPMIPEYFKAIHHKKDFSDEVRIALQKKFPSEEILKINMSEKSKGKHFIIKEDNVICGVFDLTESPKEDFIEIDFWLFKEYRNQGIMSKVLPKMVAFSKEHFTKNKLLAVVPLSAVGAQHLLSANGFQKSNSILQTGDNAHKKERMNIYFLMF